MRITKNIKGSFLLFLIILISSILLKVILQIFNSNGVFLQNQHEIDILLTIIAVFSVIIAFNYKVKDYVIKTVVIGIFSFILIISIINWYFLYSDIQYTYFTSPNKKEKFVVEETGHSEIYQMSKSGLLKIHLTNIRVDDGFRVFSSNEYKLKWKEPNTLKIYYKFDSMSNEYKEVSVKYKNY